MTNIKGRRMKTKFHDTIQAHPEKRVERLTFLRSQRSKTKKKTAKAMIKV